MSDIGNRNICYIKFLSRVMYGALITSIPLFSFFTGYQWFLAADRQLISYPWMDQIKIYLLILALLDSCLLATFLGTNTELAKRVEQPELARLWTIGSFVLIALAGFAASCGIVYKLGFGIDILRNIALATASFLAATLPLATAIALYQRHSWVKIDREIKKIEQQAEANRIRASIQSASKQAQLDKEQDTKAKIILNPLQIDYQAAIRAQECLGLLTQQAETHYLDHIEKYVVAYKASYTVDSHNKEIL